MAVTTPQDPDLAALLAFFDVFCQRARQRLIRGHERYASAWKTRDNVAALLEEAEDAFCYGFFDWLRASASRRGRRTRNAATQQGGER